MLRKFSFYATLLAVLIYGAVCLALELPWIDRQYPGFTIRADHSIGAVILPESSVAIRSGDRVLSVDGHPFLDGPELYRYAESKPLGTPLSYEIARDNETFTVSIPTQTYSLRSWIRYPLIFWLIGLLHLGMGALVSLIRPGQPVTIAHWLYSVCSALILLSAFESGNTYLLASLPCMVPFALYGPLTLNLAWHLPRRWPLLDRYPWLPKANGALGALAVLVMLPLWFGGQQLNAIRLLAGLTSLNVLALIGSALWSALSKKSSPQIKVQARTLLGGTLLCFSPVGAVVFMDHVRFLRGISAYPEAISLGLALFPVAIAYTILRHQLFSIEVLIKRTLAYTLITALIALAYLAAVVGLDLAIGPHTPLADLALTALVALGLIPLRDLLKHGIDRAFFRADANYQQLSTRFGKLARTTLERPKLFEAYLDTLDEALHPEYALLLVRSDSATSFELAQALGQAPSTASRYPLDHPAIAASLLSPRAPLKRPLDYGEFTQALLLPLITQDTVIGCVLVGPAKSGLPYQSADGVLLEGLTQQLGLSLQNAQLFHESLQRTEELERMYAELQELDRLKREFLSTTSHELRTPLSAILGYSEFLQDEICGPLNLSQQEFMREIELGARRLARTIDDMLDFARLEAGNFTLSKQEVDVSALLHQEAEGLMPQLHAADLTLALEIPEKPLAMELDSQRIGQVLRHLLNNAVKFTPRGGRISLVLQAMEAGIRFEVRDTGIGISPEQLPHVFTKFYQADSSNTREQGGVGLGLAICRSYVEAHGGRIGVESEPQAGSCFWVELPAAPVTPLPEEAPAY